MTSVLERRPSLVFLVLTVYFALNVLARMMLPESLELDESQQALLSQWLAAGYDVQPPFYNWLQYGVVSLLGVSVASLTVLKNTLLLASYTLLGLTAFSLLRDKRLAVIATLGLITLPQVAYEAQRDLTHTVAAIFSTSLFMFGLFLTLRRPSAWSYLLTGAAIGFGVLSKYNFVLLPASVLLALLADNSLRRHVLDWRIVLTAATALAVVFPHALWFLDHLEAATAGTLQKMSVDTTGGLLTQMATSLFSLATAIAVSAAATVSVFALLFGKDLFIALRSGNKWTALIERSWVFGILLLLLLAFFLGGVQARDRWLVPLFLMLPLYLCLKLDAAGISGQRALPPFVAITLAIMIIVPGVLVTRVVAAAWLGDYQKINVPYGPMVERLMGQATSRPGVIIAGDIQLAGNIRLHAPDIDVLTPSYPQFSPAAPAGQPILVVWRERRQSDEPVSEMPGGLARFAADRTPQGYEVGEASIVAPPYHHGAEGDTYRFFSLWIDVADGS